MNRIIALLVAVDWWILVRVEKFTHKFQRLTGKTHRWLARFCLLCAIGAILAKDFLWGLHFLDVLLVSMMLIGIYLHVVYDERDECIELQRLKNGVANPMKKSAALIRMVFLLVYILSVIGQISAGEIDAAGWIVATAFMFIRMYFIACDQLPPCKSSIVEWVKGVLSPRQALVPMPTRGD